MTMWISEAEFVMESLLEIVILKHSGKYMMKLPLIRQLAGNGGLGLVQLRRSHHLHGGGDLQRIPHRSYP